MRIIIEIDDKGVATVQPAETNAQSPAAVNAGGPPQALLDRLGAKPSAATLASSVKTSGATNAGGPPSELLQRLGATPTAQTAGTAHRASAATHAGGPPPELLLSARGERKV